MMNRRVSILSGAGLLACIPIFSGLAVAQIAGPISPPPHKKFPVVNVPSCQFAGKIETIDLSTTTPSNWRVTGPIQTAPTPPVGGPIHATLVSWTALVPGWIQPFATPYTGQWSGYGDAWPSTTDGFNHPYTYVIHFNLPCEPSSYQQISLTGKLAADNTFKAYLNTSSIPFAACTYSCYVSTTAITPAVTTGFVQGDNYITVVVINTSTYTGLSALLTLTAMCGKECCVMLPVR